MAGKIKKRSPVVLKLYRILFILIFLAWVVFAIKYCFPYLAVYNYSSMPPASYKSYDDYINSIQKYEKKYEAQYQKQMFWTQLWQSFQNLSSYYRDDFYIRSIILDHGNTNIQVDGVNEGDVIKNDSKYLYIISEHPSIALNNYPYTPLEGTVTIVDAYPPSEMNVVSEIPLVSGKTGETYRKYSNIYISGQNLIVLSTEQDYDNYYSAVTWADIYDITDKSNPVYKRTFELDGYLINSREQDGILYLFSAKEIWCNYNNYYVGYYNENYDGYVIDNYNDIYDIQPPEMTDQERYIPCYYDTAYDDGRKQYVSADHLLHFFPKIKKITAAEFQQSTSPP